MSDMINKIKFNSTKVLSWGGNVCEYSKIK